MLCLAEANVNNRDSKVWIVLAKEFYGRHFADKGYIPPRLFDSLFKNGIHIITEVRENTKNRESERLSNLRHKQNRRMLVFSVTSLSFFENVWTSTNLGPYVFWV